MANPKSLLGYFDAFISGISGCFGRDSRFFCCFSLLACLVDGKSGYTDSYNIQDVLSIMVLFILLLTVGQKGAQFLNCFLGTFFDGHLLVSIIFFVAMIFFWGFFGIVLFFGLETYFSSFDNIFSENRELISNIGAVVFLISALGGSYLYYRFIYLSSNANITGAGAAKPQDNAGSTTEQK